jgi:regulator of protease activity HflC (stomatin/prohibitin superfamily)
LRPLNTDLAFIISLKRSTLIFSYPQAGRPITPSFGGRGSKLGSGIAVLIPQTRTSDDLKSNIQVL